MQHELSALDEALVRKAMEQDNPFDVETYRMYRHRIASRLDTLRIEVEAMERDLAMADLSIEILEERERSTLG
jgi:hypothetical protein